MRRSQSKRGFTLAELLIAVAITAVIITLLMQVFTAMASQWRSADSRIDTFRDARVALQLIERDLSRAILNWDNEMLKLQDVSGSFAKEAYAITPIGNPGKSDLCSVGYYCAWDATAKAYLLKRLFKDSDTIITPLQGSPPNFTTIYTKDAANEEEVAAYVWDLRFTPGTGSVYASPTSPSSTWQWIEVRFKAMSTEAGRKLRVLNISQTTWSEEPPTLSAEYTNAILPNQQQFVTRVTLGQKR